MPDSSTIESEFRIGDIVTLKSHPLSFQPDGLIFSYPNYIPPFMCVKEIHVEGKKKIYSPTSKNKLIADKVKYLCVYFSQRNFKFEEKYIYESMLLQLNEENFTFHKNEPSEKTNKTVPTKSLIKETLDYPIVKYEYGNQVFFKTYKLELRKKYKQSEYSNEKNERKTFSQKYSFIHTSPALIIAGFKENENKDVYDEKKGALIRKSAKQLIHVMYYNEKHEKFSYEYLPKEFLVDDQRILK